MEEDRAFATGGDSSSARVASSYEKHGDRIRFTVDLRPGETTIVSWKKLIKDASKSNGPASSSFQPTATTSAPEPSNAGVHPALESRLAPGQSALNEQRDASGPVRFSAVIQKIERLYVTKDSSDDEELDDVPDDDQYDTEDSFIDDAELDEYFEVDKAKTKHDGFFVNRGKLESIEPSLSPSQQPRKRRRKEMVKAIGESDPDDPLINDIKRGRKGAGKITPSIENNSFPTSVTSSGSNPQKIGADDSGHVRFQEKSMSGHLRPKANNGEQSENSLHHREKNGKRELIDLNVAASKHPMKAPLVHKRDGSSFKPKTTMLDKAIRDLEKMVAASRPPVMDIQDADATSQAVKRRLSQEIKQKLAKVARVAQVSNGKASKELLSRLMSILGHLVNMRTLKRNLNIMISSSLIVNQEKDERFQQIKREIIEMLKTCVPPLISKAAEKQSGSADDFQESCLEDKGVTKVKYTIDHALEDKICDLYDIFVDGLDDDVAPQARKLYAEVASLWPEGVMDNHGIKRAICRSKERRRTLHDRNKEQEIVNRKKMVATQGEEKVQPESTSSVPPQHAPERSFSDVGGHDVNSQNKLTPSTATITYPAGMTLALPAPSTNARPKHEKLKGSSSTSCVEIRAADGTIVNKKVKRKQETDPCEVHPRPEKLFIHNEERTKSHKQHSAGSEVDTSAQNPSFQSTAIPSFQQPT